MTDNIRNLRHAIFGKPQEKQGYGTVPVVTTIRKLNEARTAVQGRYKIPDAQEERLVTDAEGLTDISVKRAAAFFNGPWQAFRQQAEKTPLKLFREVKLQE